MLSDVNNRNWIKNILCFSLGVIIRNIIFEEYATVYKVVIDVCRISFIFATGISFENKLTMLGAKLS